MFLFALSVNHGRQLCFAFALQAQWTPASGSAGVGVLLDTTT